MKKDKYITITILTAVVLIGAAFVYKTIQNNKIASVNLKVYGQSIIGEQYTKMLSITKNGDSYRLNYECSTNEPGKFCNCSNFEKTLSSKEFTTFIEEIGKLKDEGNNAKCCDHPWTEITLKYASSREKTLAVSMEPFDIEKIFNIDCSTK
jgi:hypothetical protein